jgi:hypothetical protein
LSAVIEIQGNSLGLGREDEEDKKKKKKKKTCITSIPK